MAAAAAAVRENAKVDQLSAVATAAAAAGAGADDDSRDQGLDTARCPRHRRGTAAQPGGLPRDAPSRPGAPPWPWPGGGGEGRLRSSAPSHILPAMKAFLHFLMLNTCYQSGKKEMPEVTSGRLGCEFHLSLRHPTFSYKRAAFTRDKK